MTKKADNQGYAANHPLYMPVGPDISDDRCTGIVGRKAREVKMKYTKRFGIISVLVFLLGIMAVDAPAQNRRVIRVYRPAYERPYWGYDPFWHSGWYDPYLYDPYLREQRDKYYKEKTVRDASKKLAKDQAKYRADGVITAKEQEKLMKKRQDYDKAVAKLNKFNRERYD